MLERLRRQRDAARARLQTLLAITERDLTADELREFDDLTATVQREGSATVPLIVLDARFDAADAAERAELARDEQHDAASRADDAGRAARLAGSAAGTGQTGRANEAPNDRPGERRTGGAQVIDPPIYRRTGHTNSYFRDLTSISLRGRDERAALERMDRSSRMALDEIRAMTEEQREQRALTTVDGAGGDFVPPVWMVDQFIALARAARVTADLVNHQPLPPGTDSINLPRLTTGTAVAEQATQNTAVQNTDATTGAISAAVATLAGQQVVAVQLIEQSPVNLDQVLLQDLAADYATKLDIFVISNNAAGKVGILSTPSVNAVSVAVTGITASTGLYPGIANGIQLIHTTRFMPPDTIVMHPRRWAALLSAVDTSNRPLILPNAAQGAFNALGTQNAVGSQMDVGSIQGLPVYTDPNLPTNLGAGTNQDPIIIMRRSDLWLYEGTPRTEAFRETKADQLSVLLRFYNYAAFQAGRYPKSIALLTGVGLVPPTF